MFFLATIRNFWFPDLYYLCKPDHVPFMATVVRFFGSLNYPKVSKSVTGLTEGPGSVNERKALTQFPHPQPHHSEGSPEWAGLGPPGAG